MDLSGPIGDIFGGSVVTIFKIIAVLIILACGGYIGGVMVFGSRQPTAGRYTRNIMIAMGIIAFFVLILIII